MSPADKLLADYDAVVLTGGAEKPRDLPVPGRELKGIHFAMEFLPQQNRRVAGEPAAEAEPILAAGKHVVVIGGGDTGSDCIGTSIRQGALSVTNFEILPAPPAHENKALTWPNWPLKLRTSSSHEEGAERDFAVMTTRFSGANGFVKKLHCVHVDDKMKAVPGSEFEIDAELVLLAMGFVHPVHEGMIKDARTSRSISAAMWPPRPTTIAPHSTRCSPPATCAAASRWWCGRSAKAARPRTRSTIS